jgi:cation diffusion facilitator family transporter
MSAPPTQRLALIGLLTNVGLALIKLVAGLAGHSYALVADAVESMADILGSAVIWSGLKIGAIPPDRDHPYGHGKAESLAGLVVAMLVVGAGVGIIIKSIDEILTPHHTPAAFTLAVLVLVVIVKEGLARRVAHNARRAGSTAGSVDASHHRADAITSAAAFVGIAVALFGERLFGPTKALGPGGWAAADDWAALLAGFIILYNAWRMGKLPLQELMDKEPVEVIEPARKVAEAVAGVRGIEKVRARKSGPRAFLEMHVQVDPDLPVRDAHVIGGKVRSTVKEVIPEVADVFIHVEPYERHTEIAPAAGPVEPPTPRG